MYRKQLKIAVRQLFYGLEDSVSISSFKLLIKQKPAVVGIIIKMILLNGVLFLGGLHLIQQKIAARAAEADQTMGSILWWIFRLIWVLPTYVACLLLSNQMYEKAADLLAFDADNKDVLETETGGNKLMRTPAEQFSRLVFVGIQLALLALLPYMFASVPYWILCLPSTACLYSFYAFEYRWLRAGVPFERRIELVERNLFYHLGYGLISALTTMVFSPLVGFGLASIMFTFNVILAFTPSLLKLRKAPEETLRIPIFGVSLWISHAVFPVLQSVARSVYPRVLHDHST